MLRVLIIEDEQVNREFLLLALRPHGHCTAVGTGEAGLHEHRRGLTAATPFDVVFLDIMLPGINGLKTLEMLRASEDDFDVPQASRAHVIITTVLDDDQTAARAFIHGQAASYLTKPFRAGQLIDELSKLGLIPSQERAQQRLTAP